MRIYLAAPYESRDQIRAYATELERIGLRVTSSWLQETHDIVDGTTGAATSLTDAEVRDHAVQDFEDILSSDLLVIFTAAAVGAKGGGGRHVEMGYALANSMPVVVVGTPENVFQRLSTAGGYWVEVAPDWHQAVIDLAARALTEANHSPRAGGDR